VGFCKVPLEAGESAAVELVLDREASHHPSVWSDGHRSFVIPEGTFPLHMGASSTSTREAGTFTVEYP
jgi:hypothetical protein